MVRRGLQSVSVFGLLFVAILLPIEEIRGLDQPTGQRDANIQKALEAISTGKIPPNDDQLIKLIAENLGDIAAEDADDPSAAVEAVGRAAQEAVSMVTAAYTAAIFRSPTGKNAQRLFGRFQNTVDRIVNIVKSDNSVPSIKQELKPLKQDYTKTT